MAGMATVGQRVAIFATVVETVRNLGNKKLTFCVIRYCLLYAISLSVLSVRQAQSQICANFPLPAVSVHCPGGADISPIRLTVVSEHDYGASTSIRFRYSLYIAVLFSRSTPLRALTASFFFTYLAPPQPTSLLHRLHLDSRLHVVWLPISAPSPNDGVCSCPWAVFVCVRVCDVCVGVCVGLRLVCLCCMVVVSLGGLSLSNPRIKGTPFSRGSL
jgi:hypothetical protein